MTGRRRAVLVLTAVALAAAAAPLLPESPATAAHSGSRIAALRMQVQRGELLRNHGVRSVCPRCDALVVTRNKAGTRVLSTTAPAGYGPRSLARAYHLRQTNTGASTTIAIIDAGVDPRLAPDLAVYRKQYGLPPCTVRNHCLRLLDYLGGQQPVPPNDPTGRFWNEQIAVETSLDMDAASAGCPSCKLIEVSVPWQDGIDDNDVSTGDFVRAVRVAVRAGARVISISYGYSADVRNTSGDYLKALNRKGIAVVASTGDLGFNGGAHQNWPSDLPAVVAVGGTTLPRNGPETAWSSAPFIGGLFGRAGDLADVYGPSTLYATPRSDFTDITTGQTFGFFQCNQFRGVSPRLCKATTFWDGPTGLGSPIGLAAFRPSAQTTTREG